MEPLRLKPRQPAAEPDIEDWDDDDFQIDTDDLTFRTASTATVTTLPPSRRDSASSHVSLRSDLESILDEETHVHVPGDDEKSTLDAIAAATQAGIPIPKNVPSSALMGGTIKRLGGRKIKKIMQDDWEDDLVLPDSAQALRIKPQDGSRFPDALRQVSGGSNQTSPTKAMKTPPAVSMLDRRESTESRTSTLSGALNLEKFRDNDDDDDFFGDGSETIKVSKTRPPKPISLITPPTPQKIDKPLDDDFENDFELPSDGKLRLSTRKDIPKTPSSQADDLDWGEGSLGTRFGGTRRDARSNRSSSVSAMSPSVSSSFTAESEDETFDGLVLPSGPVNFGERLSRRKLSRSPVRPVEEEPPNLKTPQPREPEPEDMFDGLDVGDGDVFNSGKLTLHRNIRVNANRPPSPQRPKTAISLTFTNKATPSRLPRPSHERHERTQSALEPVSESGGPIFARTRRSQSRMGHQSQSSVTSIHSMPTPTTPSPSSSLLPSTPRRRELGARTSTTSLRNEPTTTSTQLLRFKRSLPAMSSSHSPAKTMSRFERPPSRTDGRPPSSMRPKTPTERSRPAVESFAAQQRRPFLPAGASQSQSQHVTAKTSRSFRRHDSENALDLRPTSRAFSRSTMRSPSPKRTNRHSDHITRDGLSFRTLTKPNRTRNFGDGHELDGFDDLPTSAHSEAKFVRQPVKAPLRNKLYQNVLPDRTTTPSPAPYSPAKGDYTPHFARDTQASRIARETSLAQRAPSGPLAPLTSSRVSQLSSRNNFNPGLPQATVRSKKKRNLPQLKPHLISNMNKDKTPQHLQGMFYNPDTYRWEGNENILNAFDPPASSPSPTSMPPHVVRDKEASSTPRPALITNISHTKGVQVVGGMVFDPQNMCWLKLGPQTNTKSEIPDPMDGFNALDDDEDVFKDIPDLDDNQGDSKEPGRVSEVKDEWLVGEEFDVGPEFVRRQREEEDRWRKKCEKWLGVGDRDREAARWAIRDILLHQRAA